MFPQPTVDLKPIHNRMPVILEPAAEDICGFKPAICPTLSGYPRAGLGELNPQPYWGFDDLEHLAGTKLLNCFYIQADVKREGGQEFW